MAERRSAQGDAREAAPRRTRSAKSPAKRGKSPAKRGKRPAKRGASLARLAGGGVAHFAPCGTFPRVALQAALREGRDYAKDGITLPIASLPQPKRDALLEKLNSGLDGGKKFKVFVTATGDINLSVCALPSH